MSSSRSFIDNGLKQCKFHNDKCTSTYACYHNENGSFCQAHLNTMTIKTTKIVKRNILRTISNNKKQ